MVLQVSECGMVHKEVRVTLAGELFRQNFALASIRGVFDS